LSAAEPDIRQMHRHCVDEAVASGHDAEEVRTVRIDLAEKQRTKIGQTHCNRIQYTAQHSQIAF
jgi:hypothetical protein